MERCRVQNRRIQGHDLKGTGVMTSSVFSPPLNLLLIFSVRLSPLYLPLRSGRRHVSLPPRLIRFASHPSGHYPDRNKSFLRLPGLQSSSSSLLHTQFTPTRRASIPQDKDTCLSTFYRPDRTPHRYDPA